MTQIIRGCGKASEIFALLALLARERGKETLGEIIEKGKH